MKMSDASHLIILIGLLISIFFTFNPVYGEVVAEWRMDETAWTGVADEVIDSSNSANHGVARNGGSTTDSKVCQGGRFRGEGYNAPPNNQWYPAGYYVEVAHDNRLSPQASGINAEMTISGWFRPDSLGGTQTIMHKGGPDNHEYRVYLAGSQLLFDLWNHWGGNSTLTIDHNLSANNWYFFAFAMRRAENSVNVSRAGYLYGDSQESPIASVSLGSTSIPLSNLTTNRPLQIGATNWNQRTQFFNGLIDELRIHDSQLTEEQIRALKGITRPCPGGLTCVNDDFNRTDLGDNWASTHTSGSFGDPRIVNDRFRLTNAAANVATAATLQNLFPSAGNLVTIEYDYFAYGGSGADGITVVLSDADITPAPGGYGGSLGYANRCGVNGFDGGWLGIGLDTFGNFANNNECRQGRLAGTTGQVRHAVGLRGSGSGQTGYRYITGTNTLSPTLRTGTENTSHRYRITIDSQTAGQSWVTIERNTGNGMDTLVGPVDVLASSGQAAVPENFLLTLTGSTGGSNDNHEIDNLEVCAIKMEPIKAEVHHYRLQHSGYGLTCETEPITVTACSNNECTPPHYDGAVQLTLTPNSGWIDGSSVNFTGGEGTFGFRHTTSGDVTLGISASSPAAANVSRCINLAEGSPCLLRFDDVGLRIDGDAPYNIKTPFPTQIAGKTSSAGFNAADHRIRVVRTNSETGVCEAAVSDQSLPVKFSYLVPVAAEGLDDTAIEISGSSSILLSSQGAFGSVTLAFDENGRAPFVITPRDAGRYQLRAQMDIPVTDTDDAPLDGVSLTREDTTPSFVVRPLAVYVDSTENPRATDAGGTVFKHAGELFSLDFRSIAWTAGRDPSTDGRWGDCGQANPGAVSGNFARVPAWNIGSPVPTLVQPLGGGVGALTYGGGEGAIVQIPTGQHEVQTMADYAEVGIINFQSVVTFLGENVAVCSPYIGRFVPDHFTTTILVEGTLEDGCSDFTYTGQPFGYATGEFPDMLITARGQSGNPTLNYRDDFVKLTDPATQISMPPAIEDVQLGEEGTPLQVQWAPGNPSLSANNDGTLNFVLGEDQFAYVKEDNALIDKFVSTIRLSISEIRDSDGVTANGMPTSFFPAGTEIRYGRMVTDNAYGAETLPLPILMRTEFFDGASFVPNSDDSCTAIDATNMKLRDFSGNLEGDTAVSGSGSITNGFTNALSLSAPGAGNEGSLYLDYDLDTAYLSWLQFDWNGDGVADNNPSAKATFGIFKGNSRLIYMRELVW
jgi:MSHA biogenesis protein MshQ